MSLFPAYNTNDGIQETNDEFTSNTEKDEKWLENSSYVDLNEISTTLPTEDNTASCTTSSAFLTKTQKPKKKKRRKSKSESCSFTGNEEYYVDKKYCKAYLTISTLHKPACPKYSRKFPTIGYYQHGLYKFKKIKRYYSVKKSEQDDKNLDVLLLTVMDENDFTKQKKELNENLKQNPKNIELWRKLIQIQDVAPIKCNRTQLAEKKIHIIEKALIHNLGNDTLYKIYIDIINSTYPSFEVSKILENLINKDQTSYILWNANIFATQGSMARCIVPNVLKLYEDCMQKMYRKSQQDEILLRLFSNCALFLRQAGLSEQFFALIKLALELNISVDNFTEILQPSQKDQQLLIEYEEVILKSGLPMNEIWIRIEKLRQNFNFLPCPVNTKNCSDPQRIIFNEDICYFIYPLKHKEHSFQLILIILKLLKIPMITTSIIRDSFLFQTEQHTDFDAIEEIFSMYSHQIENFNSSIDFNSTFYDIIKDFVSSPSFLFTNIGSEIYFNAIVKILLLCAEYFNNDDRKKQIFILIWLRFERIMIIIKRIAGKLITIDDHKLLKSKIKNLFKKDENRNIINYYVEYALIEYQFGNLENAEKIFVTAITEGNSKVPNSDFCNAYICYAEIMLQEKNYSKALQILTCYAFDKSLNSFDNNNLSDPKKISCLEKLTERLNDLIQIEKNVQVMELEQHYLPDFITSLFKIKIYYQILLNKKLEAIGYLENTLKYFVGNSPRALFIREKIYEFYMKILQMPSDTCLITNVLMFQTVSRALNEFPNNLFILKVCATLEGQPWYKIRGLLESNHCTPVSVIFLIVSARCKFLKCNVLTNSNEFQSSGIDGNEETYKIRVRNLLKTCLEKKALKKNPLLWRIYLRCICEKNDSFEKVKNILFTALDECPWIKELYLDGAICAPQELPQLQDLLIEKQLRIYALPEELEILRNDENLK